MNPRSEDNLRRSPPSPAAPPTGTSSDIQSSDGGTRLRVVSGIQTDPRDPARVVIHVDGRREAVIPRHIAEDDLRLSRGMQLTPEIEDALTLAGERHRANQTALNMLNRRSFSRGELIERLTRRKGVEPAVAEDVAEHLVSIGLINDAEYGRSVLRELTNSRPAGPALMRQRLRSKRIEHDLIGRLIDEHVSEISQDAALDRLVQRKLAAMRGVSAEVKQRRLYGLLARRGFDADTATNLIRAHLQVDERHSDEQF